MINPTIVVSFLIICGAPFKFYSEGSKRHSHLNWNEKSYILDPSWIIDNGLTGKDILPSSFLKKNTDTNEVDALSQSSYITQEFFLQSPHDDEHSGIIDG